MLHRGSTWTTRNCVLTNTLDYFPIFPSLSMIPSSIRFTSRRLLWWCVYICHRFAAISLNRKRRCPTCHIQLQKWQIRVLDAPPTSNCNPIRKGRLLLFATAMTEKVSTDVHAWEVSNPFMQSATTVVGERFTGLTCERLNRRYS